MRYFLVLTIVLISYSCSKTSTPKLTEGKYRAVLKVKDNEELPFTFDVQNDSTFVIYNAEEKIVVDEIAYKGDSITIQTPVFEGYITAKINENSLEGEFIKPSLDRIVPFSASKNSNRFITEKNTQVNISGNWETVFSKNTDSSYVAKGIFNQTGNKVTGTFRTTTGDYRYLEGVIDNDTLLLSTFDGAHAFLFKAKVTDSIMNGYFYSGNHWKEPFTAKLNPTYKLPKEEELTYLKEGYNSFNFSFPDTKGRLTSIFDEHFDNKVVVVQIMGTWCPNCLDESKFLVKYLKENPNTDLQVVALAFEVAKTREIAYQRINRLKERVGIEYPILLAQFGNAASKTKALEKLPMLNKISAYPTTIFIDKNKNVRKIHTGFNGPATGEKYNVFVKDFEKFVAELLAE